MIPIVFLIILLLVSQYILVAIFLLSGQVSCKKAFKQSLIPFYLYIILFCNAIIYAQEEYERLE